ncbi:hypothetical protein QBC47DRAFT_301596 [Echria macrotheca]|uniref:DUF7492 domain-containing protein n=1 Tax=Echria macrotheca TaxID=438768 RepID=A0AAJ0BB27_9PEZI|nr:hypothetical protein QBC47DRAFT_301596 [Echria macrotheca]
MIGQPGFERSHVVRGSRPEDSIVWLLPPNGREKVILPDDKIARPDQRPLTASSYSAQFPMLKVAPGDFVAIQYTENGHVSRAELTNPTKPVNRGTVYLYGTTQNDLSNYNLVDIHLAWTADGKGGDGKGKLLATRNFDDGQCHEAIPASGDDEGISTHRMQQAGQYSQEPVNGGLSCQSDLQIPFDAPVGQTLTVIWVWDWPTMNVAGVAVPPASYHANVSTSGEPFVTVPELYTGVVDYQIVDPCDDSLGDVKGPGCGVKGQGKNVVQFAQQKIPSLAAIQPQMLKPFMVEVPQAGGSATAATANPTDIPLGSLVGMTSVPKPIPSSLFAPPPDQAPAPPAAGPSSAPAPTPTPAPSGGQDGILTVTVTVPATTVYVTQSVEVPAPTGRGGRPSGRSVVFPRRPARS